MNKFFGVLSIIAGIFVGLYVGLWWAFVGGIIQVVDAVQVQPIDGSAVGWGIARIVLATTIGEIVAVVFFIVGAGLIGWNTIGTSRKRRSRR